MDSRIKITSENEKIPTPPPPEVEIRTMKSDLRAFQEGGGELPGAGMKAVFTPTSFDEEREAANDNTPRETIFAPNKNRDIQQGKSAIKFFIMAIGALIIIIGLGLLGYYVMFPVIFK